MLCNSWIIISKETGKAVCETYNKKWLDHLNYEKYEAMSAYDYLVKMNKQIKKDHDKWIIKN